MSGRVSGCEGRAVQQGKRLMCRQAACPAGRVSWELASDAISGQPGPAGPIVLTPAINVCSTARQAGTSKLTVLKCQHSRKCQSSFGPSLNCRMRTNCVAGS